VPQLFCNKQHVASNASQLRELFHRWQQDYGSILAGCEALFSQERLCRQRTRSVCGHHSISICSSTNNYPTMMTLPNPQRRFSFGMISRYLVKHLPQQTIRIQRKEYKRCFCGKDLLEVFRGWLHLPSKQTKAFGQQLVDYSIVLSIQGDKTFNKNGIYRLHALDRPYVLNWCLPLIDTLREDATTMSPYHVVLQLCRVLDKVFHEHKQNPHDIFQSKDFQYFEELITMLREISLPSEDPILLVNLYNLMVRHTIIIYKQTNGNSSWQSFLGQISYQFHSKEINLEKINLRLAKSGMKGQFRCFLCQSALQSRDPRYKILCSTGTISSPNIELYENDEDIDDAIRGFVQQQVECRGNELRVPKRFATLFNSKQDFMEWLVQYLNSYQLQFAADHHHDLVIKYNSSPWRDVGSSNNDKPVTSVLKCKSRSPNWHPRCNEFEVDPSSHSEPAIVVVNRISL